ncbi:MAG: response regulator [Nitrospirae bacterium]|nr:response regulator [Nitrospirota bacterium]
MGKRVLVVDDEEMVRTYLTAVLEDNGFEVILAEDGLEGYNKAIKEKPDLIVSDVMMPKKNGISLLQDLRINPEMSRTPIIILSAVQSYLENASKEIHDPKTLEDMKLLLENIDSSVDKFLYRFQSYRKMLFMQIADQVKDYKVGASSQGYRVLPDMFIDKPVDPDNFIEAVKGLLEQK